MKYTCCLSQKHIFEENFTHRIEKSDADVLDDAVQCHELEDTEGSDESSTSLPVKTTQAFTA